MNKLEKVIYKVTTKMGLPLPIIVNELPTDPFAWGGNMFNFIHLADAKDKDTVYHEVGHLFYDYYCKDLINQDQFKKLFGNPGKWYFGKWYFQDFDEDDYEESDEHITIYAQVHPLEDWAETFAVALDDVLTNQETEYEDCPMVNKKLKFVRACIRKSMSVG